MSNEFPQMSLLIWGNWRNLTATRVSPQQFLIPILSLAWSHISNKIPICFLGTLLSESILSRICASNALMSFFFCIVKYNCETKSFFAWFYVLCLISANRAMRQTYVSLGQCMRYGRRKHRRLMLAAKHNRIYEKIDILVIGHAYITYTTNLPRIFELWISHAAFHSHNSGTQNRARVKINRTKIKK